MLRALVLAAVLLTIAAPAAAQDVPVVKSGENLALTTLGHTLTFPPPVWLSADESQVADPLSVLEVRNSEDSTQAKVEFVPKGQSFGNWQNYYAVNITLAPGKALMGLRDDVVLALSQTCQRSLTSFFQLTEDGPDALPVLGFACGAYVDTIEGLAGKGGITIVAFRRTDAGVATVREAWQGPSFDITSTATWPVPSDVVQGRMGVLDAQVALAAAQ